jgi:hypothetical protein
VNTVLGLIGIVLFIAGVISLAAGVTWVVVKLSPDPNRKKKRSEPAPES